MSFDSISLGDKALRNDKSTDDSNNSLIDLCTQTCITEIISEVCTQSVLKV